MKTTTQQCSKELHTRGIVGESEKWWCTDLGELTFSRNCRPYKDAKCGNHTSAYSFQELLLLMPKIGEVLGWTDLGAGIVEWTGSSYSHHNLPKYTIKRNVKMVEYHSHHLLDIFLDKGMEGVSATVCEWFAKHD